MSDTQTNIPKKQLSFSIHWGGNSINAWKSFLDFYDIPNIQRQTIGLGIKKIFNWLQLKINI